MLICVVCAAIGSYGEIWPQAAPRGHVWICGPVVARGCLNVYGFRVLKAMQSPCWYLVYNMGHKAVGTMIIWMPCAGTQNLGNTNCGVLFVDQVPSATRV